MPSASAKALIAPAALIGLTIFCIGIFLTGHSPISVAIRIAGLAIMLFPAVRWRSITGWTAFAILAGVELGIDFPSIAIHTHVLAEIFLRLVRVIIAPLIFATLTTGIAAHGHLRGLGRVAWKALLYFEIVTTLSLLLGAIAINVSQAGLGVTLPPAAELSSAATKATQPGFESFLLDIFPENLALAVSQNQILQVAVFSILFGISLALLPDARKAPLLSFLDSLSGASFQFVKLIMYFAPIAAGAAMSYSIAGMGLSSLLPLVKLAATFYVAALAFILLVLLPIILITKIPLRPFIRAVGEPAAIGFATSSSEAALPLAMERMEEFGVPRRIVSFVIPAGYSFNMDGSSLYLSVAAIFAAQVSGIHMSIGTQVVMLLTLMVTSKGIAGVPRAVLAILLGTAASFHLSTAAIMMILGIDTLIDMGRTSLNVIGNCLASAVINQWEPRDQPEQKSDLTAFSESSQMH
jgi:proton glutamate symport protein